MPLAVPEPRAVGGAGDEMVPAGARLLAEFDLVGIASEISVERDRDEMFGDVIRIDLCPGEPPGSIRGAGASCATERRAIGSGEND